MTNFKATDWAKCEHFCCREKAVWKIVSECMVGAAEWNFYCNKHKGNHLGNGDSAYLRPEGWLKD